MKTLDDVIKAYEICIGYYCSNAEHDVCPYFGESGMGCMKEPEKDALHYLKVLQKMQKAQPVTKGEWDELYNDPALDWEELRQMTGKPVWLESHGDITEFTGWVIVSNVLEDRSHFIFSHYDGDFRTYEMTLPDYTFGKEWNVYRKERE